MRTAPPDYQDVIEFRHGLPVTDDADIQTLEQALMARLDRLETGQDLIVAAILGMQQQLSRLDRKARSRRRFRTAWGTAMRRMCFAKRRMCLRAGAYCLICTSMSCRAVAWLSEDVEEAAEFRRYAEWAREAARCLLECLKADGGHGDMDAVLAKIDRSCPPLPKLR
jgi:hypothetical protein